MVGRCVHQGADVVVREKVGIDFLSDAVGCSATRHTSGPTQMRLQLGLNLRRWSGRLAG